MRVTGGGDARFAPGRCDAGEKGHGGAVTKEGSGGGKEHSTDKVDGTGAPHLQKVLPRFESPAFCTGASTFSQFPSSVGVGGSMN
jgi:hypothetical protein